MHHLPEPAELQHGLGVGVADALDALEQSLQVPEQEGPVEAVAVTSYTTKGRVSLMSRQTRTTHHAQRVQGTQGSALVT